MAILNIIISVTGFGKECDFCAYFYLVIIFIFFFTSGSHLNTIQYANGPTSLHDKKWVVESEQKVIV